MFGLFNSRKDQIMTVSSAPPKAVINRALAFQAHGIVVSLEPDQVGRPLIVITKSISDEEFEVYRQARLGAKERLADEVDGAIPASVREKAEWLKSQREALANELAGLGATLDQLEAATAESIALRDDQALERIAGDVVSIETRKASLDLRAKTLARATKEFFSQEWPEVEADVFRAVKHLNSSLAPCGTDAAEAFSKAIQKNIADICYAIGRTDGLRMLQSSTESILGERRRELGG